MPADPDAAAPPDLGPILLVTTLPVAAGPAWSAFVDGFGEWWPVATHSLSRAPATRCALEPAVGGRVYETAPDGTLHLWGTVEAVEAVRRLRFSWHPGREPESAQWIEVRFEPRGAGTVVSLRHGGWEALGEIAPLLRAEYVPGWHHVFKELYGAYAAARVRRGS